jgi:flotillin
MNYLILADIPVGLILTVIACIVGFGLLIFVASRYRRCPSDRILVVYGKVGGAKSARCTHGGAAFVWPVIQDYAYLDLTPIPIDIQLRGALSQQNIRINTPSTFTVGISTEPGIMENAAERMLGLSLGQIQELAKDIIFGQMRVAIATMPIEEINADRDKLVANISTGVEVELKKVGLRLINVNIQDITDESGYIDALGREAAARAINEAKVQVAEKERDGDIGAANADKEKRISVAAAGADAVQGENEAAVQIANSNASRREREAEAQRIAISAEKVAEAKALEEAYAAEETAERARASREEATRTANIVVDAEIEKRKIEVLAEADKRKIELAAEADKRRVELAAEAEGAKLKLVKQGEAEGLRSVMEAQAQGTLAQLQARADGFRSIVEAAGGATKAAQLMVTEQLPKLVEAQVEAVSNLKIDKVTVWDSGATGPGGKTRTADFLSGMVGSIPPLHEIARNAGVELPEYLGRASENEPAAKPAAKPAPPQPPIAPQPDHDGDAPQ